MAEISVKNFVKRLGKSVSEISRETGISRNSIAALINNDVDGIKFSTLAAICRAYRLEVTDVLELRGGRKVAAADGQLYKQEGDAVPFTCWPWVLVSANHKYELNGRLFGFGPMRGFSRGTYSKYYWDRAAMDELAKNFYEACGSESKSKQLYRDYLLTSEELEQIYHRYPTESICGFNPDELANFFNTVRAVFRKFWEASLFIDSFDPGFDQAEIARLAKLHGLTTDEVVALTTPDRLTFNNEMVLAILDLAKKVRRSFAPGRRITADDPAFSRLAEPIDDLIERFDYVHTNYGHVRHLTRADVIEEMVKRLRAWPSSLAEYRRLSGYTEDRVRVVAKILKRHKLSENPLAFFNLLTFWREHRKKVNLMGIHVLDRIMDALEAKTGMQKKYLAYIGFDEFTAVLHGALPAEVLRHRHDDGMLFITEQEGGFKIIVGAEAVSVQGDLDRRLMGQTTGVNELRGQIASQGYHKGRVKVVLTKDEFDKIKTGDVLVTSMTRPEFVPIMKTAGAIVTNEGGITCHAAIVSRELGKPCIIGTAKATEFLRDNDLVEVRANHGTIRILERKNKS